MHSDSHHAVVPLFAYWAFVPRHSLSMHGQRSITMPWTTCSWHLQAIGRLEIGLHSPHQRCVFGRLPSNEVVLEHLSISRQHAQLSLDSFGELLITDLGSGKNQSFPCMQILRCLCNVTCNRPFPETATVRFLGWACLFINVATIYRSRALTSAIEVQQNHTVSHISDDKFGPKLLTMVAAAVSNLYAMSDAVPRLLIWWPCSIPYK